MTLDQCNAILEVCISSCKLMDVNLARCYYNDVFDDEPDTVLLARAASNLQSIDLSACDLTTEQYIAVLESSHFSSKLMNVSLRTSDLREVPVELMFQAASQFQTLDFQFSKLTA